MESTSSVPGSVLGTRRENRHSYGSRKKRNSTSFSIFEVQNPWRDTFARETNGDENIRFIIGKSRWRMRCGSAAFYYLPHLSNPLPQSQTLAGFQRGGACPRSSLLGPKQAPPQGRNTEEKGRGQPSRPGTLRSTLGSPHCKEGLNEDGSGSGRYNVRLEAWDRGLERSLNTHTASPHGEDTPATGRPEENSRTIR